MTGCPVPPREFRHGSSTNPVQNQVQPILAVPSLRKAEGHHCETSPRDRRPMCPAHVGNHRVDEGEVAARFA